MDEIIISKQPKGKNPSLVAAWPGMGGVAIIAARYLIDKLGAVEFGSIAPEGFFDLSGVLIEDSLVQEVQFPQSRFYYGSSGRGKNWLIFVGEAQPQMNSYRLANLVLDVAQRFSARRVYTFAAAPTHIYHTKKPRVLAVATEAALVPRPGEYEVGPLREGSISGLNGLLLGAARQRSMDGICLLGEIPIYTTNIANPRSSKAVLEVLSSISKLNIDLSDMDDWAHQTDAQIEERIGQLRETFGEEAQGLLDYFDQLAEQTTTEDVTGYRSEELLKDIERFLRDQGEQRGSH